MIEKNILEWLEVGDSIQKLDIYSNKSTFLFLKQIIYFQDIVIFHKIFTFFFI